MSILFLGDLVNSLLGFLLAFLSVFLIMLVLIQRGKGGGLTGALGGPGGQSAFGSKAGDTFTVITIVVASIWGFTCAFTMWLRGTHAPTPVSDTNVQSGPGDDAPRTNAIPITVPSGSGFGVGGSGLEEGGIGGETPSKELIPANRTSETPAAESTEAPSEESAAPPADGDGETPEPAKAGGTDEPAAATESNESGDN